VTAVCVVLAAAIGMWATRQSLGQWLGRQQSARPTCGGGEDGAASIDGRRQPAAALPH